MNRWFEIDKQGLAELLERRGKGFVLLELLQNAWDQNVTTVEVRSQRDHARRGVLVSLKMMIPRASRTWLTPSLCLRRSTRRRACEARPVQLGQKLFWPCGADAYIITTKGTVVFNKNGRRTTKRAARDRGSVFHGFIRITPDEYEEALS